MVDPRTPAAPALGDASAAALAEFEPASMLRPGHAFSLAPLSWGPPPPPPPGRRSMPARFLTELLRYIPVRAEGGVDATPLRTPGLAAPGRLPFTTPPSAEPTPDEPPVKRSRPADAGAAPALPLRASSYPLLATWHPLLAPSVAWPAAPMPPRALIVDLVSDAADAALAYVGNFAAPPGYEAPRRQQAAPASPGDAEGAEAMLALLHGDGGPEEEADEEGDEEKEEEQEDDDEADEDDDEADEEADEDHDGQRVAALGPSRHQCSACGTCNSPMWRKHPTWRTLLCNACGLRVMRGRPPLVPGSTPQGPPRRLFHKTYTPPPPPSASKRKAGGLVNLGRADEGEAAHGASTPAETGEAGALRRPTRGWRPNPKFYGEDAE